MFLTCSSPTSRNYTVGYRLGKGERLDDIIKNLGSVAEGVSTSKGLHEIVQLIDVEAPVSQYNSSEESRPSFPFDVYVSAEPCLSYLLHGWFRLRRKCIACCTKESRRSSVPRR